MSGKGDKRRPELVQGSYSRNYDKIFKKRISKNVGKKDKKKMDKLTKGWLAVSDTCFVNVEACKKAEY